MSGEVCRKRRNCSLQAISPFETLFSEDLNCRQVKTWTCSERDAEKFEIDVLKGYSRSLRSLPLARYPFATKYRL